MFNPDPSSATIPTVLYSGEGGAKISDLKMKSSPVNRNLFADITYSNPADKNKIKAEDAVCFRYVSEGGNLSLYLKKNSDISYTKTMTIENIELQGYFTICCPGWTYMDIDDFSMSNTSPIYEVAPTYYPEPITKIENVFVNQTDNFQTNLDEEIKINKTNNNIGIIISCSVGGAAVVGLTTALILVIRKKKHEK